MASDRFFRRGRTKVYWVPTIAATTLIPTVAEVTAGTNMSKDIADMSGFEFENSPINTPDLDSTFTSTIPGEDQASNPSLTFYEKKTTNTLQATVAKGTSGFLVIFFKGLAGAAPAVADEAEVWPVTSTGPRREYSMGNDPARWMAGFAPSDPPNFNAAIAA